MVVELSISLVDMTRQRGYLPVTTRYPGISGPRRTVQTWPGLAPLTGGSFIVGPAVTNVRADAESTILTLRKTDGYK